MAYKKENALREIRAMVSALYVLVIWIAKISTLIQFIKAASLNQYLQVPFAISTLISSSPKQNSNQNKFTTIRSYLTKPSVSSAPDPPTPLPTLSSPTFPWSNPGDLLGTESGIMISNNGDFELLESKEKPNTPRKTLKMHQIETRMRKFPPPIPSLIGTENFTGKMPWKFEKEIVEDRLIIRAVQSDDDMYYFEKIRENGRLIIKLARPTPFQCGCSPPENVRQDLEAETETEESEVKKGKNKMEVDGDIEGLKEGTKSNPYPKPSHSHISCAINDSMVQAGSPTMASTVGVGI